MNSYDILVKEIVEQKLKIEAMQRTIDLLQSEKDALIEYRYPFTSYEDN